MHIKKYFPQIHGMREYYYKGIIAYRYSQIKDNIGLRVLKYNILYAEFEISK